MRIFGLKMYCEPLTSNIKNKIFWHYQEKDNWNMKINEPIAIQKLSKEEVQEILLKKRQAKTLLPEYIMKSVIKNKYLKTLEAAMLKKYYSPYQFCIGGYSEECLCLTENNNTWVISRYERGQAKEICRYNNILDGCIGFINSASADEKEMKELKDAFITVLFAPEQI